jgi:hypothetical protein
MLADIHIRMSEKTDDGRKIALLFQEFKIRAWFSRHCELHHVP